MLKVLISRPSIICNDDQQIINLDKYLNLRFPKCCKIEICNMDVSLYDYRLVIIESIKAFKGRLRSYFISLQYEKQSW